MAGTDIISWLIATEIDPPGESTCHLTDAEIAVFARLLLLAGGGTTWRQLGITLFALLTNRGRIQRHHQSAARLLPRPALDPDAEAPYITGGLEQRGVSGLHVLLR